MNIRFHPEKRDVVAAVRRHGRGFRPLVWLSLTMCGLGLILLIVAAATRQGDIRATWMQTYPAFILAAIFTALWQWSEYAAWKNLRCTSVSWKFEGEEVSFETESSTAQLKWPSFLYYKEGKKVFLLYQQKNMFNFIPKRALTHDEVVEFRTLLAKHLPTK